MRYGLPFWLLIAFLWAGMLSAQTQDAALKPLVLADATVKDLSGKVLIPGLVDTHSHLGIYPRPDVPANADGNEMTGPVQSGLRALDAIWPADPGIRMAQEVEQTTEQKIATLRHKQATLTFRGRSSFQADRDLSRKLRHKLGILIQLR